MKTALITGATSGIGLEMALILAQKGYNLILASRRKDKLEELSSKLEEKFKIKTNILAIDLSLPGSAKKLFEKFKNYKIEILINNAGFGLFEEHRKLDIKKVEEMIYLNIVTLTNTCSLFGAQMKERNRGYILNLASTAAFVPLPYSAAYAATKSYVLNFSEAIAKEFEDYNVSITCLSPGMTDTNFFNMAGVGNKNKGMFAKSERMSAKEVAKYGIQAMFSKKLSVVPGIRNRTMIFTYRFFSRKMIAKLAKIFIKKGLEVKN